MSESETGGPRVATRPAVWWLAKLRPRVPRAGVPCNLPRSIRSTLLKAMVCYRCDPTLPARVPF